MLPNRSHDMAHILVLPSGIHLKASGRFLDGVSGCPSCCPASPRAEGMSALTYSLFGTLHSLCEAPQSTLVGSSVLQTDSGRAHYWRIQQFGSNWVNSITKGERKIFKNVDLLRIGPVKFVYISSRFVVRSPIFMLAHYLWSDRRTNLIYLQIFSFLPVSEHVPPRWSALSPAPRP